MTISTYFLWITDPWDTLDHPRDTTIRFMQEAALQGISQAWCDVKSIRLEFRHRRPQILMNAKSIIAVADSRDAQSIEWGLCETCVLEQFSSIHYRTDPPVDLIYWHPLQLLAQGLNRSSGEIINPLEVLFMGNEKIESIALPGLMPPSVVSSAWEELSKFGRTEGKTVLKPLHDAQSHGVKLLFWHTNDDLKKSRQVLQSATLNFKTPILLQKYLTGIADGELRLWFLDGELLMWFIKHPVAGDFRVNLDRGSVLSRYNLTTHERQLISPISKYLRAKRIRLAAVDLIDGLITDFNFTSPGIIPQGEELWGENFADPIISALSASPNPL